MEDLDADGGLELSSSEYKSIFKEFADGGMINYEWFLDEIIKSGKSHGSSGRSGAKAKAKGHVERIIKEIRKEVRKAWKEGVDYHEAFERFDRKVKGWISSKDFLSGLSDMKIKVNRSDESALLERFDPDEKGKLCTAHIITMHGSTFYDTAKSVENGGVCEASNYSRLGRQAKRIFRVVPFGHPRCL